MFDSKRKSFSVNSDPVSTAVAGRPPYHWNWKIGEVRCCLLRINFHFFGGLKGREGLTLLHRNVRMFECLDWKQPEQLVKTTCIWCAG